MKPACPKCQSKKTEKLLTPPAIHFKGSGFYKTDARSSTTPKEKKLETEKGEERKVAVQTPSTETEKKSETCAPKAPPKSDQKGV